MSCAIARFPTATRSISSMVVSQLAPETTREELAEYFAAHHAKLVSLLPEDTTCKDLFEAVNLKRPIARFFAADDDPAIGRELERLEMKLVGWANEAAARSKKRAALLRKNWFHGSLRFTKRALFHF